MLGEDQKERQGVGDGKHFYTGLGGNGVGWGMSGEKDGGLGGPSHPRLLPSTRATCRGFLSRFKVLVLLSALHRATGRAK